MKDGSQSAALIESRTLNKSGAREVETLEIGQVDFSVTTKKLQLAFLVDNTASMSSSIALVKTLATDVATLLSSEFGIIEFALIQFKDEGATTILTGAGFVTLAAFQTAINPLTAGGGGDTLENGYGAVALAGTLPWDASTTAARAIFLVTDAGSHTRGATQQQAIDALAAEDVIFFYQNRLSSSPIPTYTPLVAASVGTQIAIGTAAAVAAQLTDLLKTILTVVGISPIFLCNDNAPFTALDEEGNEREYLARPFDIGVSIDGTNGTKSINLTVDNSDLQVSQYLSEAIKNNLPIEVIYRLYLSNDLTGPQNNPPLRVYLSDVEVSGSIVSGALGWVNLVNSPFPNEYYKRSQFPSL